MVKYVKLNGNTLEYAPKNKGAILNYNLNVEKMIEDGYKEFVDTPEPNYSYIISYEETSTQVIKKYTKIETVAETAEDRENRFNQEFLITSKGAFRIQPRGFANALQAVDFIDKQVKKEGLISETVGAQIFFYSIPDFTKVEECTEEWILQHQNSLGSISKEEWEAISLEITQLYLNHQYLIGNNVF